MTKPRNSPRAAIAIAVMAGALLLQSHPALAQVSLSGSSTGTFSAGFGGGALFSSGTNFLNALVTLLTSTWAQLIGVIAVFTMGILWMFGRITMHTAFSVITGIILVFGAPAIVSSISSSLG